MQLFDVEKPDPPKILVPMEEFNRSRCGKGSHWEPHSSFILEGMNNSYAHVTTFHFFWVDVFPFLFLV